MNFNEALKQALREIQKVRSGSEFILKDLFVGHIWNDMNINVRRTLGRVFLESVPSTVELVGKNSSNQQVYKKI